MEENIIENLIENKNNEQCIKVDKKQEENNKVK